MKKLNWGDTLLGFEVTPEVWNGTARPGVVLRTDGKWVDLLDYEMIDQQDHIEHCYYYEDEAEIECVPIYPPRGWNGLSEEEIWAGLFNDAFYADIGDSEVFVSRECGLFLSAEEHGLTNVHNPPAFIQALQNAQVLSERLK